MKEKNTYLQIGKPHFLDNDEDIVENKLKRIRF